MDILIATGAALLATSEPAPAPPIDRAALEIVAPATENDGFSPLDILSVLDLDFKVGPWTFHGYLQYDGAAYHQAAEGPPETDFRRGGVHLGDPLRAQNLSDGSNLRRARLGWEGTHGEHVAYRAMFELGGQDDPTESRVAEVWASYNRGRYTIQAGAYGPPSNMEGATGADSTLFLERASAADLARSVGGGDGRIGVTVRRTDFSSMAALSFTGPLLEDAEDYMPRAAIVGRYARAITWRKDYLLHFGVNGTYVLVPGRNDDGDQPNTFTIRFLNTPEIDVDDTPLIDTGDITARHTTVLGGEFAAQHKNLYLQAEGFWYGVQRHGDVAGNPNFIGFYVQGSWILTGETRRFDRSRRAFTFPKPDAPLGAGGLGAWELGLRYSVIDLNYRAGAPGQALAADGVRGGRQEILGAALLWYPRARVRLMLNYLHVRVDRLNPAGPDDPEPFGPAPSTPPVGVQIGQTLDIVALRFRYSF